MLSWIKILIKVNRNEGFEASENKMKPITNQITGKIWKIYKFQACKSILRLKRKKIHHRKNMVEANKIDTDGEEEFTDSNLPQDEKEKEDDVID